MYEFDHVKHAELAQRYTQGASWFFWIAGLSLITSLIAFFGGEWGFILSLGITQLVDAFAQVLSTELGSAPKVIGLMLNVVITAVFVLFGVLAGKKYLWAYLIGMVAFILDGLLSLVIQDWIGVLAHGFVLYFLVRGFMAGRELVALEAAVAQQPPPVENPATASSI